MADPASESNASIGPYQVDFNQRLTDFYVPAGNAYTVSNKNDGTRNLYALLIDSSYAPRLIVADALRTMTSPALQPFLSYGVLTDASDRRRKLALIYEKPNGTQAVVNLKQTIKPIPEDALRHNFLSPMQALLTMLSERGIYHGRIRPDTVFWTASGKAMVAECISCLPGLDQPALFESIDRAMTTPAGRGDGTMGDDLFALGMTTLFFALGRHPFPDMSDDDILHARLEEGTWGMILNRVKVPQALTEPLRGLLADNAKQRWDSNDLLGWLDGQRVIAKPVTQASRASRAIQFGGRDILRARTLAVKLPADPEAARQLIERELDGWLRRSIGDQETADYVHNFLRQTRALQLDDATLVAYTSIALDPPAPLRYKDLNFMPDGIGSLLVEILASRTKGDTQTLAETITRNLLVERLNAPHSFQPYYITLNKSLENVRRYLDNKSIGYGLERALYELNKNLPCQSDMFKTDYVSTPKELLLSLNKVAQTSTRPGIPIDRHCAAFLATHDSGTDSLMLQGLSDKNPAKRNQMILQLLAQLQQRYDVAELPALANWMVDLAKPVIEAFHSKKIRTDLTTQLAKTAKKGDLPTLYMMIGDENIRHLDKKGFENACAEFQLLSDQIQQITYSLASPQFEIGPKSRKVAASISFILALMAAIGYLAVSLKDMS